jgi:hypothetical protein
MGTKKKDVARGAGRVAGKLEGYAVHDPLGRSIGRVGKVFTDERGEVRSMLIPVKRVEVDERRRVVLLR